MFDKIEKLDGSLIQHGPNNDRVYLMKLAGKDAPGIIDKLHDLSLMKKYTKIFAKVPEGVVEDFIENDFKKEATIPKFFKGREPAHFVSRFMGAARSFLSPSKKEKIRKNIAVALTKKDQGDLDKPDADFRALGAEDAEALAGLYEKAFKVYPFPIFDERYLRKTMDENIDYFGAFVDDKLVAASSAEKDKENKNAEMTDFATLPKHRGKNLSYFLLKEMEGEMVSQGYKTLFTIARAESIGMNATFARTDYEFAGTLVNNTQIGESIESMNVWYKNL
ncbi:MAG: putative beta-lysine N-acetyltransferase [Cyclobacteriaceae bacterium]|nr:putative beta-lysine N-acetyltransferase [Cyclobacteriaceae bacterium]MCB0500555.1 putative beta-lysine N-acetyltransferase [Cyclobacteriaceae bacterium]MCB9239238.1 putative beta-lysine N-acetyltransferase [Flammeovirgaceae bacterium]MCO5272436.1 putative beta-lysine N-acetyltransferase [Cyclobacteriaceae bacterium]MCW5903329.1 putative beta-lysine N-acetyltransferase [Cyclobacteriaceae bacterium]